MLAALAAYLVTGPISPLTEWIPESPRPLLVIPGLVVTIAAIKSVPTIRELTRVEIPEDGTEMVVRNPHPAFAHEAIALGARQLSDMVTPVGWLKRREPF
ncbi:hypothetical protein EGT50_12420 [Rhodococcus xishaensis]|uniref:Uncharacterized protein n=2 Tax=Rhodococcus xishaensis TaxID=2487364 RepID=A0A438AQT6_9NOCA|nr:hypothetical protein EGT50_12420 [Rhodococcus xishaensis]